MNIWTWDLQDGNVFGTECLKVLMKEFNLYKWYMEGSIPSIPPLFTWDWEILRNLELPKKPNKELEVHLKKLYRNIDEKFKELINNLKGLEYKWKREEKKETPEEVSKKLKKWLGMRLEE